MVSRKFRGCVHYCVTTVCYDALDISPFADLGVPHKRVLLFDPANVPLSVLLVGGRQLGADGARFERIECDCSVGNSRALSEETRSDDGARDRTSTIDLSRAA